MNDVPLLQRTWFKALLVFGIWTLLGLVDACQTFFYHLSQGEPIPVWAALAYGVSDWYLWALFTPVLVWMVRRWPLDRTHWDRMVLHIVTSICTALIVIALGVPIFQLIFNAVPCAEKRTMTNGQLFHLLVAGKMLFYVLTHWLILGIAHGLFYYGKYQERALQASHLQTQLAQTQLQMLKMQLHPHFLFNTLHAISALMHRDVAIADRMLAQLGQLLRTTLEHAGTQHVSLRDELEFIQPYLEIETARLGARLTVRWDIDPAVLDAEVPNLLLQPLVENAIRHGVAPRATPGVIEVTARKQGNQLTLEIRDNGPGLPPGPGSQIKEGVGVGNTRARLRHLYGDAHRFEMRNASTGGLIVNVDLPYRESPPTTPVTAVEPTPRVVTADRARLREKLRPLIDTVSAEANK